MADVKWIKITTDIFDDEKFQLIDAMPEADAIELMWFKLLVFAGRSNNNGIFMFNDKIAYTDEMLSSIFHRPVNTVRLAMKTFTELGMVESINDVYMISNWSKHQSLDAYEKKKERDKIYSKERRKKQAELLEIKEEIEESADESSDSRQTVERFCSYSNSYSYNINLYNKILDKDIYKERYARYRDTKELNDIIVDWLTYKDQRGSKHKYTERGLASLLTQVLNNVDKYGIDRVRAISERSMSNNYTGILWDKISTVEVFETKPVEEVSSRWQ